MAGLKKKFENEIIPKLKEELGLKNPMSVPRLSKVVLNMGLKEALVDKRNLEEAVRALSLIAGQRAKVTRAKKSIASFKLREGDAIGLMATLRDKRMYDFFEKLVAIVLPALRDFSGLSEKNFDQNGNYTLGLKENTVFPEIEFDKIDKARGLEVTIVTTTRDKNQALALLKALGMPFVHAQGKPIKD